MSSTSLTDLNKAANLLICLGKEAAAAILKELTDDEINLVTRAMATINYIPKDIQDKVLKSYGASKQKLSGIFVKGEDFTKKAIAGTNDGERTCRLIKQFDSDVKPRPLETIALMQPHRVADLLANEHPQIVALILATQQVEHAGQILANLSDSIHADVIYRIAKTEKVSSEVITRLEEALASELSLAAGKEHKQIGGVTKVANLLDTMNNNLSQAILENIGNLDPRMAEKIKKIVRF
mgnify:CR=1 FL=1